MDPTLSAHQILGCTALGHTRCKVKKSNHSIKALTISPFLVDILFFCSVTFVWHHDKQYTTQSSLILETSLTHKVLMRWLCAKLRRNSVTLKINEARNSTTVSSSILGMIKSFGISNNNNNNPSLIHIILSGKKTFMSIYNPNLTGSHLNIPT